MTYSPNTLTELQTGERHTLNFQKKNLYINYEQLQLFAYANMGDFQASFPKMLQVARQEREGESIYVQGLELPDCPLAVVSGCGMLDDGHELRERANFGISDWVPSFGCVNSSEMWNDSFLI